MKFFIHDKCFDQLIELPKAIQKKVFEFQRKFREDSRAAAIHLEPISTFKDPYLRTARIDVKYRAIIKVPQRGDDYHLLWVDNHDEAMAWAANKVFEWNENTQSAQLFTVPDQVAPAESAVDNGQPVAPLAGGLYGAYTDEQLLALGVPAVVLPLVRPVEDLNGLDAIEQYLPAEAYENLFYLADGATYENLLAEIQAGKVASANYEEQLASSNNRRSLLEIDDKLIAEMLDGEPSKWQLFLHPSQRKLVEGHFNGAVKVTGGGGTGKTVAALHRLRYLTEALPQGAAPALFTTFTNALTANLRELVGKLGIRSEAYVLINVDSLARKLAEEANLISKEHRLLDMSGTRPAAELWEEALDTVPSEFDAIFMEREYQDVVLNHGLQSQDEYLRQSRLGRGAPITRKQRLGVWSVIEAYQQLKAAGKYLDRAELFNRLTEHFRAHPSKPFSHVIADEIQDFGNAELRFLRSLVDEKANDLFLVGDPYQKIYARRINFSAAGINVRGTRSKRLRLNYRTTEEIKRLAIATVRDIPYDNFDGEAERMDGYLSLFHGQKPTYSTFADKGAETAELVRLIRQYLDTPGVKASDIVVGCRLKDALREIRNALHQTQLPYFDLTSNSGERDGIRLSSFHSLKGLEFKVVLLADVNERTCPLIPKRLKETSGADLTEHLQSERSLLYVAITRAIQQVHITGTGSNSALITL